LIILKQRAISFLVELLTAQISLNVRGTDSLLHAMYMHAARIELVLRPLMPLFFWTEKKMC
jgi:hypothetical protein